MNINRATICGRTTTKPVLKSTKGGQQVTAFSIATNRNWTDKGGQKQEAVDFHNIVLWGKLAELAAQYVDKGQVLYIEGRIQTRKYEDKNKTDHYITEIVGQVMQFGQKAKGSSDGKSAKRQDEVDEIPTINIDEEIKAEDLPF